MSSIELPADDSKPFWSDPTFLLAAVPTVLSVLVVLGYIPKEQVDTVNGLISDAVRNGFLFGTSVLALWKYFHKEQELTKVKLAFRQEYLREALRAQREELKTK